MDRVELATFAAAQEKRRWLCTPFSMGAYSYAGNGHIMLRVTRLADVAENPDVPFVAGGRLDGYFDVTEGTDWLPCASASQVLPSAPEEAECAFCNGRGRSHDCPMCECICPSCQGAGAVAPIQSGTFRGIGFNLKYLRRMLTFGNLEIADTFAPGKPLSFRFDGGAGVLMPLSKRASEDVVFLEEHDQAA